MNDNELSKAISHALRHEPWLYELELDDEGWALLDTLLEALRSRGGEWAQVGPTQVERMIAVSDKKRHELEGGRIRALYGHSLPNRLKRSVENPPSRLFHGTSPTSAEVIARGGLQPMGRQYVHLSVDIETALAVGKRNDARPVLLVVDAQGAQRQDVVFYVGNDKVWLADHVPPNFISVAPTET